MEQPRLHAERFPTPGDNVQAGLSNQSLQICPMLFHGKLQLEGTFYLLSRCLSLEFSILKRGFIWLCLIFTKFLQFGLS